MSDYPFVQAKHFRRGGNDKPTRIVVHRMEAPEKGDGAEACARYFQTVERPASAHLCVDNNSIVRCVADGDVAFHAPPNAHSLGIEHAGIGEDWGAGGQFDTDMLRLSARAVARWCRQYDLPAVWLSPADLRAGKRGITSHFNVSQAWHQTTHTDGKGFPVEKYLALVRSALNPGAATGPTKTFEEVDVQTKFVTMPPANGYGLAELFVDFGKEVVPVGEPCVHGPDPSAGDGWWPDTIGIDARAQPRGNGLHVTIAGAKAGVAVPLWVSAA